jgi:hypothetical protein
MSEPEPMQQRPKKTQTHLWRCRCLHGAHKRKKGNPFVQAVFSLPLSLPPASPPPQQQQLWFVALAAVAAAPSISVPVLLPPCACASAGATRRPERPVVSSSS